MHEQVLADYRKHRAAGLSARSAYQWAVGTAKRDFERKLRGFRVTFSDGGGMVSWDGVDYQFEVGSDDDSSMKDLCPDIEIVTDQPGAREYTWGTYLNLDGRRGEWAVYSEREFESLRKYYRRGYARHEAHLRALQGAAGQLEYAKGVWSGNCALCYVNIPALDESQGWVEWDDKNIEDALWDMLPA